MFIVREYRDIPAYSDEPENDEIGSAGATPAAPTTGSSTYTTYLKRGDQLDYDSTARNELFGNGKLLFIHYFKVKNKSFIFLFKI